MLPDGEEVSTAWIHFTLLFDKKNVALKFMLQQKTCR